MCGSGSTIIQAVKNNRKFIGIDIEKDYIDITKQRLEEECSYNYCDTIDNKID